MKSATDCLAVQAQGEPALLSIYRHGDAERVKVTAMVALNIAALDRFLHLKNPLSEEEIDFIAEQIIEEFGGAITFADVHLVMKRAKAGAFGRFYERISAPDVLGWFREWYDRRLELAYEYNRSRDRHEYNGTSDGREVLQGLGYVIQDGKIAYDEDRIRKNEEARRKKPDKDEEAYSRFKAGMIKNNFKINN